MNKTKNTGKISALVFSLTMALAIIATVPSALAAYEKTYTLDADFDEGILVGVEHDTVHDQLQLSTEQTTLPFIWVPNSNEGTVSKVDTNTGKELGRYKTGPDTLGNPSRTTVDLKGNVWFGNRDTGTVVKIGLYENGQCQDKNGNGIIETSKDLNNDGNVVGAEILPWGSDECVLFEIAGITGARGIAVDSDNNLWAGGWSTPVYKHINGETGAELASVTTGKSAYGAIIDASGWLWSSEWTAASVGRLDPVSLTYASNSVWETGGAYGMGIDADNNLFISGYFSSTISKYNISTGSPVHVWTRAHGDLSMARGVVVTSDGDVWVAASGSGKVLRLSNDGVLKAIIPVGDFPTGVSVDQEGKVWVVNFGDGHIKRIDPATDTIDLDKLILGSGGSGYAAHYGYSDMTGFVARTITTKVGTWTVDSDSGSAGTPWGTISWNSAEDVGIIISIKARSSEDGVTWSTWEDAVNNVELSAIPDGKYLQTQTTFQIVSGDISPALLDLTVKAKPPVNQPPTAEAGGPYSVDEGSPIMLDGSGSFDPDAGDTISYAWDLDNDGSFETTGVTAQITPEDGPQTMTVGLKVTDSFGNSDTDTATVTVNNLNPVVGPIEVPIDPQPITGAISVKSPFTDEGVLDTHVAVWNWDDGTTSAGEVAESGGSGTVTGSHTFSSPGIYTVKLVVTDKDDGIGEAVAAQYIVVYGPGFVTGGGTIDSLEGSYVPDPTLSGKANFGFVAKYQKGATVPTGVTEFQFHAGSMNFHSDSYEWLVVAGQKAIYKGVGHINDGAEQYKFMLSAIDSSTGDKFRIKISDMSDVVVYDNQMGATEEADPATLISGGSIVIHNKK